MLAVDKNLSKQIGVEVLSWKIDKKRLQFGPAAEKCYFERYEFFSPAKESKKASIEVIISPFELAPLFVYNPRRRSSGKL